MDCKFVDEPKKLLKICPGCAMDHFSKCRSGEETAEDKPCVSTDKLLYVLDSGKRLCRVSGDLSVTQLLGIVYHVVATALLAVGQLTAALVPVAQYIILLLIHGVECFLWVSKEPKLNVKFFKGLASVACMVLLWYLAYLLVCSLVIPTLTLLSALLQKTRSLY